MFVVLGGNDNSLQRQLFKFTGCRGRPSIDIPREPLEQYLKNNFTIEKLLDFSVCVPRRIIEYQLHFEKHSSLTDAELDDVVSDVLKTIPRCGYWNMCGHLHPRGHKVQWDRIQDSMRRLCLEEILMWALQLMAVRCRTYFVQAPLSLWHINGNHKLMR